MWSSKLFIVLTVGDVKQTKRKYLHLVATASAHTTTTATIITTSTTTTTTTAEATTINSTTTAAAAATKTKDIKAESSGNIENVWH